MTKKAFILLIALLMLFLVACRDKSGFSETDAEQQGKSNTASQSEQQQQSSKEPQGYQIKFSKFVKSPTFDYHFKEAELLTACLKGINAEIRPGQEFSHSSSASEGSWSMSLKMTGQYGETKYRDGVIPALKGQMEFSGESNDPRSGISYKFSGPFVLPFATLRPVDPDHETIRIGQADVVGEREKYLEYYEYGEFEEKIKPPEEFLFIVNALE